MLDGSVATTGARRERNWRPCGGMPTPHAMVPARPGHTGTQVGTNESGGEQGSPSRSFADRPDRLFGQRELTVGVIHRLPGLVVEDVESLWLVVDLDLVSGLEVESGR